MDLVAAGEVAGLVVAVGGCTVVVSKGVRSMRRFARFLDGWFGDGTVRHSSVVDRLTAIEAKLDAHVSREVPEMLADGQAWGKRIDARLDALELRSTQGNG